MRTFTNINNLSGLSDYYLTAYESVFDFLANLNQKKLRIEDELFKASIKLGRQKFAGIFKEADVREKFKKETYDSCKEHLFDLTDGRLKFKDRKFETLLLTDMRDFHHEYQLLLQKYKDLSTAVKRQTEPSN
jgi:hypothetical protein